MSSIELAGLKMDYGAERVLHGLDLKVEPGEFLVLVGPSGCGKSTILRLIAGLARPAAGRIRFGDRDVTDLDPRSRDVAMVFQNYALYPHRTVRRNISFPLEMRRIGKREAAARIDEVARALGIAALLERRPHELSGGQMQRVALARALVRNPAVFLFDEPLSNLDARLRIDLRREIVDLHRRLGITTVYVTHDQAEAMTMGSRLVVLDRGRIRQQGRPLDVHDRPTDLFVAEFIGSPPMNCIRGTVHDGRFFGSGIDIATPLGVEGEVVLGFRPHDVAPAPGTEGVVVSIESTGRGSELTVALADESRITICADERRVEAIGDPIGFRLDPSRLHWFNATGERFDDDAKAAKA